MQKGKKRFNPGEAIIPAVTLAFGVAYFLQTKGASLVAVKWPYIIAVLTAILWLAVVANFLFDTGEQPLKIRLIDSGKRKVLLILVAPVIYVASMPYIGFGIASLLFLTILFRILGGRSLVTKLLVAFSITAFLYISMIVLMQMSLPRLVIGSIQI
jgi:hypothetical protein